MARKVVQKTSFLGGEAGPKLEGRSDLAQFQLGGSRIQNFIVDRSGAAARRPGSVYVKNTLNDQPARLLDFVLSYDDGSEVYVVELTLATSTTMAFRVIRASDNQVFTPTGSPFTVENNINLNEIQYAQIGDAMFIVHKGCQPIVLQRTSTSPAFTISNYIGFSTGSRPEYFSMPYRDINVSSMTMTPSATTGSITLTASSAFFQSGMINTYMYLEESGGGDGGFVKITGVTNSTTASATVLDNLVNTTATTIWAEGAWSSYRGWPRTVTFYNQRTVFGGNTSQPDTFWASETSDYYQMSLFGAGHTAVVSDPQNFTLASQRLNQIRWMVGGKKLTIGTSSSEWVGVFVEDGTALRVEFNEETSHGSAYIQPKKSAYTVPFVQRSKKMLREMVFDFNSDSYVATDLNLFASHIGTPYGRFDTSNGVSILQLAFQEGPFNILWAIDTVGRLYGLTRDKQQQVASWHSHVIGGKVSEFILTGLTGADYPAFVTSICVVPSSDGSNDRLWMVVRRDIDGNNKYYVEYLDDYRSHPYVSAGTTGDIKVHLDCMSIQTGAASTAWGSLSRFAGEDVYVVASNATGAIVQDGLLTVDGSGNITLPVAATTVVAGLHANAEIRPLPFEGGDAPEIKMRALKRIEQLAIRMFQTWGLKIGRDRILRKTGNEVNSTDFDPIVFDSATLPTIPTYTGIKEVSVPGDHAVDTSFALVMDKPWPCTILSLSARVTFDEV